MTKVTVFEDFDNFREEGDAGAICYMNDPVEGIALKCPCCARETYIPLQEPGPVWKWDGNKEKPTLSPSIQFVGGCRWHGWLRGGEFVNV